MSLLPMPFNNPHTYPGHSGVDFPQPLGTPIPASGSGVVSSRNKTPNGGYQIWVAYDGMPHHVGYAHMPSHASCPKPGTRVKAGTKLGVVGVTGHTSGPHVHVEISGDASTAGFYRAFDKTRVVGSGTPAGGGSASKPAGYSKVTADVQKAMNTWYNAGLKVDGVNGPATKAAILNAQRKLRAEGLYKGALDGVWGPQTNSALNRHRDKVNAAKPKPSSSTLIRKVQQKLKTSYPLYASKLAADGIQGPATTKAVKEFQRRSGLTADGIVGPRTRKALGV